MMRTVIAVGGGFAAAILFLVTSSDAADDFPHYVVHRSASKILIDGHLDEPAWRNAATFGDFKFPWWEKGKKEQTVARMLWDETYLYVAYECEDAHISAVQTGHDSPVYKDDCVELFTAPNPDKPLVYFNIEMNVNRAMLDRYHPEGPGKPQFPNWNTEGVLIATSVDGTLNDDSDTDRGWILEVAIPFANFEPATGSAHPVDGDVWHLNLNRLGGETNAQYSQWSPGKTEKPAFHAPETFGRVTFSTRTSEEQALHVLDAAGYESVPDFLKLPTEIELGACSAVDIDSRGTLYLFHRGAKPIIAVSEAGEYLRSWGNDLIGIAHGLRVDKDDNIWVTDIGHHTVFKFDSTGKLLLALGTTDRPGDSRDQFNKPTDIAFGPDGEIFVSDGYGNSRVMKFDQQGKFLATWGMPGTKPGEFRLPHSIVVDQREQVLVGDRENDRIQVFDLNGNRIDIWEGFAPYGIALDSQQQAYIADGRASAIIRLDRNGKEQLRLGSQGHAAGQFELPHMLAVGRDGSLYVAEVGGKRFQKFRKK